MASRLDISNIVDTLMAEIARNGGVIKAFFISEGADGLVIWERKDAPFPDRSYAVNRVDLYGSPYSGAYDLDWEEAVRTFKDRLTVTKREEYPSP